MKGAGVGLIGLLLTAGIIFYLAWGGPNNPGYVRPALEAKKQTEVMTNALSGRDEKGTPVTDTITYEPSPKGIVVSAVTVGGAMDIKYGIRAGDVIIEIGPLDAATQAGDPSSAKAFLQDAYGRGQTLTVRRGEQKITLPDQRNVGGPAATAPTNPEVLLPPKRQNSQGQAKDLINKIQSH